MFQITQQLTNVRPAGDEAPELVTTPTLGNIRINQTAGGQIGVINGDYLLVVEADANDGKGKRAWIAKGAAPVVEKDPNDPEKEIVKEAALGAKLATSTGKMGGNLTCSSTNAYNFLGGNDQTLKKYKVTEEKIEFQGMTFYALEANGEEAKVVKQASKKADTANAATANGAE